MGVVSECCCKEVYYTDILIIIITFPYSTCISSFLAASSPFLCSFLNDFSFLLNNYIRGISIFLNDLECSMSNVWYIL